MAIAALSCRVDHATAYSTHIQDKIIHKYVVELHTIAF
mgnify:CR=1 FL=1